MIDQPSQAVRELKESIRHMVSGIWPVDSMIAKKVNSEVEAVIAELEATKKRLDWFDACKFEDQLDIQEAIIAKLGLVDGKAYEECRNQLEAVTRELEAAKLRLEEMRSRWKTHS